MTRPRRSPEARLKILEAQLAKMRERRKAEGQALSQITHQMTIVRRQLEQHKKLRKLAQQQALAAYQERTLLMSRTIVRLNGFLPLRQIADMFGVSRQRIYQILAEEAKKEKPPAAPLGN